MKVLKAKTSHLKKTILAISDLTYNTYYETHNPKLTDGVDDIKNSMDNPIEVFKHIKQKNRFGVNGEPYIEKTYSVLKGSQRVTQAKKLGYTHIEALIKNAS
jgi:hypothetical protein|tara:strand:+ start:813 stop:1118 length:306 start_codon:yes stop_codon:yes gene_type:complete